MAVWIVRAGRNGEREDLALEQGLVVIGWEEVPDLMTFQSREGLQATCFKTYPDRKPQTVYNWVGQLWAFAHTIQAGELVVLPRKRAGARVLVAVGTVTGPYTYRPDLPPDAYHTRPVRWINKEVPWAAFPQDLRLSMGTLLTVGRVHREQAEERVQALAAARPIPQIGDAPHTEASGEPTADVVAPLDLEQYARDQIREHIQRTFHGHDLARLVTELLRAQGYATEMSPPGPDGGVDIVAGRGPMGFDAPRLCVQVKSGGQVVDAPAVRQLQGVMRNVNAEQGLFVSWGGFRQSVVSDRRQLFFQVRLWDADTLVSKVLEYYDHLAPDVQAELPLKRIWTLVQEVDD